MLTAGWQICHIASYRQLVPEIARGHAGRSDRCYACLHQRCLVVGRAVAMGASGVGMLVPARIVRIAQRQCRTFVFATGIARVGQELGVCPLDCRIDIIVGTQGLGLDAVGGGGVSQPAHCTSSCCYASSGTVRMQRAAGWIRWRMVSARHIVAVWVVAYFGYLDLPTAALLAPNALRTGTCPHLQT